MLFVNAFMRGRTNGLEQDTIEYYIADVGDTWGVFREGVQLAVRHDAADAIAFANFFADRETLMTHRDVRVVGDACLNRTLIAMRHAA
jgi:hypothetical protein